MSRSKYYVLDVFAEEKYHGNQLAVFTDIKGISDNEMQKIAREVNFSETTFILDNKDSGKGFPVRIFTPMEEVDFAGHPTLGTAWIIKHEILKNQDQIVNLDLKVGTIPVSFNANDILWMKQKEPKFGDTYSAKLLSEILRIKASDIDDKFPVQVVSTGLPAIIVPLKTLKSIKQIRIDKEKYLNFLSKVEPKVILAFCPETYQPENQLNVRVFVDYFGIPEDPATGSGNGCLAGYLVKHLYFKKETINITCEQGYEIQRPSRLYLKAALNNSSIEVEVGGKVQLVASGEWI
jgi:trans-2,3-dihydro-3-hydroxyanthranilate isomerase